MKVVAAIRTHVWTDQEDRLMAQLRPVFGDDLCVVFHNRAPEVTPPLPVVDLTDGWLDANGLRRVADYGWRCGDYFLYALRAARPDADFYWLIEPDVHFTGDPAAFFAALAGSQADLIGPQTEELKDGHRFAATFSDMPVWRCTFALTRVSGRALDWLVDLRRKDGQARTKPRFYSNDESFVWSHVKANPQFSTAELVDLVPEWMAAGAFRADPDILLDTLAGITAPGVYHPVQSRKHFVRAVGKRVTAAMGFLDRMRGSLSGLTDDEMTSLVTQVSADLETRLRGLRAASLWHKASPDTLQPARARRRKRLEGQDNADDQEPARQTG